MGAAFLGNGQGIKDGDIESADENIHPGEENKNMEGQEEVNEEELVWDENEISNVISRFFSQTSENRLKNLRGLKSLLQDSIDFKIAQAKF